MDDLKPLKGYLLLFSYLAFFLVMIGIILLIPLIMLIFYPQEVSEAYCFLIPGITSIFLGYIILFFFRGRERSRLENHEDALLVIMVWIIAILVSAIPFMLTGKFNFTESIFEMTSGFSTTGLSVVDVSKTSHLFLFYRSIILFVGGVGLVLVLTCALSDKFGLKLYKAEGHSDKLLPNLASSARMILSIYAGYILLGTILYICFGMNWFDALNHSIASLSTGGFSTKVESIGYYNSLGIEVVTILLMILGNTNFFIHLLLLKGHIKEVLKHCEVKFFIILSIIMIPLLALTMYNTYSNSFGESLRLSFFQFYSCLTTTGFQTVSEFKIMPSSTLMLLTIVMLIGGAIGSTAGGIKQYRIVVMAKGIYYSIVDKLRHRKLIRTHYINFQGSKEILNNEDICQNNHFVLLYLIVFLIGSFIFTCYGYSVEESMFEFASCISTVGVGCGITAKGANPVLHWTGIVGMFMGRLELLVFFEAIFKIVKDVKRDDR